MYQLSRTFAVVALALTLGLHWTFLQSVAWMSMLVRYSQTASFSTAVARTFDGKHPCALCKQITQGKKAEREQQREFPIQKIDLCCHAPVQFLFVTPDFPQIEAEGFIIPLRTNRPPTPPPRIA